LVDELETRGELLEASGAAISDSSFSRRGVDGRDTPGSAKTVELPRRAPGVRGRLRDAFAAQIRQHRRRRRQYRCIMSHSGSKV
jgi:hypothetical protein